MAGEQTAATHRPDLDAHAIRLVRKVGAVTVSCSCHWSGGYHDSAGPARAEHGRHLASLTTEAAGAGLMTVAEHKAMDLTAQLFNLMCAEVIGHGPSRRGDIAELAADIHRLQDRVLAQAAARAYPGRYRLLGGTLGERDETDAPGV